MEPLTVCIIARDAGLLISDCLSNIQSLTPNVIVVVDDRTTDSTIDIAKSFSARVITHQFTDFASQKNLALSASNTDWNLFLDVDERLSEQLISEIKTTLTNPKFSAYLIPRLNYIFNRAIYHTNWDPQNDSHIWLFKKSVSTWSGQVHEEVHTTGSVGKLANPKLHLAYRSVEEFISKLNLYTSLEPKAKSPIIEFFRRYIWHLGFLDSWHGLFLSYLMALYQITTLVKLWQKKNISS